MAIASTIIYCANFQTYIAHIHSKVSYNISQFQTILEHMNTYIVPTMSCVIVGSSSSKILAPSESVIFTWRYLSSKILDALMSLSIISGWMPSWRYWRPFANSKHMFCRAGQSMTWFLLPSNLKKITKCYKLGNKPLVKSKKCTSIIQDNTYWQSND